MTLTKLNNSSNKQVTKIRLDWRQGRNNKDAWNEICAWCIENYGLPGDKFEWHANSDYMDFDFYNEKDAIHFGLRWL